MSFKNKGLGGFCRRDREDDRDRDHRRRIEDHVHEVLGSVQLNERREPHSHRFATVSGEAIRGRKCHDDHDHDPIGCGLFGRDDFDRDNFPRDDDRRAGGIEYHVHEVRFRTDTFEDHYHEFNGRTGGPIRVGDRHVHFLESVTSVDDGHNHEFRVATLIDDPTSEDARRRRRRRNDDRWDNDRWDDDRWDHNRWENDRW